MMTTTTRTQQRSLCNAATEHEAVEKAATPPPRRPSPPHHHHHHHPPRPRSRGRAACATIAGLGRRKLTVDLKSRLVVVVAFWSDEEGRAAGAAPPPPPPPPPLPPPRAAPPARPQPKHRPPLISLYGLFTLSHTQDKLKAGPMIQSVSGVSDRVLLILGARVVAGNKGEERGSSGRRARARERAARAGDLACSLPALFLSQTHALRVKLHMDDRTSGGMCRFL
jgi:hypothetical protein